MINEIVFASDTITLHENEPDTYINAWFEARIYGIHNDLQIYSVIDYPMEQCRKVIYDGNPNKTITEMLREARREMHEQIWEWEFDTGNEIDPLEKTAIAQLADDVYCGLSDNLTKLYISQNDPDAFGRAIDGLRRQPAYTLPIKYN